MKTLALKCLLVLVCITFSLVGSGQGLTIDANGVAVNKDESAPDQSAILDVQSTEQGILVPRMTDIQMNAVATPANGLMVYNLDNAAFYYYNGTAWTEINGGGGSSQPSEAFQTLTDNATVSWDLSLGRNAEVVLGGNRTLNITNVTDGQSGYLEVRQDANGSRTITLPAGSRVTGGGGGVINLSSAPNAVDILFFKKHGSVYTWSVGYDAN